MDDGVFVWHTDVPYGNSRPTRGPGAHSAGGAPPGVCFFASFFAQAKKRFSTAGWLVKKAPAASGAMCLRQKTPPARPSTAEPIADVATADAVRLHGLRWPSPQPLSPTGTSFGRRRERGSNHSAAATKALITTSHTMPKQSQFPPPATDPRTEGQGILPLPILRQRRATA